MSKVEKTFMRYDINRVINAGQILVFAFDPQSDLCYASNPPPPEQKCAVPLKKNARFEKLGREPFFII